MRKQTWKRFCLLAGLTVSLASVGAGTISQSVMAAKPKQSVEDMTELEKERYELTKKYSKYLMNEENTLFFPSKYYKKSDKSTKAGVYSNQGETVTIPTKYDSREKGVVSSVKNQEETGMCWSFSILESAQAGYKAKNSTSEKDLSEWQIAYFMYNQPIDELSLLKGDSVEAKEYDWFGNRYTPTIGSYDYYQIGGNAWLSIFGMSRGIGVCEESDAPFNTLAKKFYKSYDNIATLNDSKCYQANDYTLNNAEIVKLSDSDTVKKMIMDKGAASISYYSNPYYYAYEDFAYYNPNASEDATNHAVTVVGWDDNYSKKNFYDEPSKDGAWLIKNSWGESWGNDGYFWISYEEPSIQNSDAIFYDVTNGVSDHVYQYDGTLSYETLDKNYTHMANVFTAKQNETINAVSFHTVESNTKCEVSIYKNLTDKDDPISGKLVASELTATYTQPGYYTMKLEKGIDVNKGDTFAVVVKQTCNGAVTTFYVDRDQDNDWVVSDNTSKVGESFVSSDGTAWKDISEDGNSNMRIKAFTTVNNGEVTGTPAFEQDTYNVEVNDEAQLNVLMGNTVVNDTLKLAFQVKDSAIAEVDSFGNVYAKAAGQTTVTVKYGTQTAECTLVTTAVEPTALTAAEGYATKDNPISLFVRQEEKLQYSVEPAKAVADIRWTCTDLNASSNSGDEDDDEYDDEDEIGIYVDEDGTVSLTKSGDYKVTATIVKADGTSLTKDFYVEGTYDVVDCETDVNKLQYKDYENMQEKYFVYNPDTGAQKHLITFADDFALENEYDYITVYGVQGNVTNTTIDELYYCDEDVYEEEYDEEKDEYIITGMQIDFVGSYTGTELRGKTICVEGEKLVIRFESDKLYNDNGFRVTKVEGLIPIETITLDKSPVSIEAGTNQKINVTVAPENYNDSLIYTSSNEKVATVDKDGTVHAHKAGSTTITVDGMFSSEGEEKAANITVNVTASELESMTFKETEISMVRNGTQQLSFNEDVSKYNVEYTSSAPGKVSVDEDGLITAHGVGKATITATVGDKTTTATVTVTAPNPMTLEDMQCVHNYVAGMDENYTYTGSENAKSLKVYFDNKTDLGENDYFEIKDSGGNLIKKIDSEAAWNLDSVTVPGNQVTIHLVTFEDEEDEEDDWWYEDENSSGYYGFRVRSIEEGAVSTSVRLDDIELEVADVDKNSVKLKPVIEPAGALADVSYEFVGDNDCVYLEDGVLYARRMGKTTIKVTISVGNETYSDTATVTVKGTPCESLKWSDASMDTATEVTFTADTDELSYRFNMLPEEHTDWLYVESSDEDVVEAYQSMDSDGNTGTLHLCAYSIGDATVTIKNGEGTVLKQITVYSQYQSNWNDSDDYDQMYDEDKKDSYLGDEKYTDGNQGKLPEKMTVEDVRSVTYGKEEGYAEDTAMRWKYYNKSAQSLSITFSKDTKLEDDCDRMYIYTYEGQKIGMYTYNTLAGKTLTINSKGFIIVLRSDESMQYAGFALTNIVVNKDLVEKNPDTPVNPGDSNVTTGTTDQTVNQPQAVQPAAKGSVLTINTLKCQVVVTSDNAASPTVAYKKLLNKKATKVTVPKNVTVDGVTYAVTGISDKAFASHKKLKTVTIPATVTSIGKSAFKNCKKLKTVTIGANVKTIGKEAFMGCKNLKTVKMTAGKLKTIGKNAFKGINKKANFKLKGSKKAKKALTKKLKSKKIGYVKTMKIK